MLSWPDQQEPSCPLTVVIETHFIHLQWTVRAILSIQWWSARTILSTHHGQREPSCPLSCGQWKPSIHLPWLTRAILSAYHDQWESSVSSPWSTKAIPCIIMVNKSHLVHLPWSVRAILCPFTIVSESHLVHRGDPSEVYLTACHFECLNWLSSVTCFSSFLVLQWSLFIFIFYFIFK